MRSWSNEHMLQKLGTAAAGEAWSEFLQRYTPLMLAVARQYHHAGQDLHDSYLFVCEKLVDNDFGRLRAWQRRENVRFASWLRAVVANLCVDWHRSEHGRLRPFQSVAELPEREQLVYRHRFEFGASFRECYEAVAITYPELSELDVAAMIRRINRLLTPQQHWVIATRRRTAMSLDDPEVRREVALARARYDTPEEIASGDQEQVRLQAALQQLPVRQRLLLKLRYRQGLTLKEVARLAGYDDSFKARYQIRLALERLQTLLRD